MTFYPLPPSPTWDDGDYQTWDDGFTKRECETIIKMGETLDAISSVVGGSDENQSQDTSIRKSKNSWLVLSDDTRWIYDRLGMIARSVNGMFWRFDITGFNEDLQYTRYNCDGDFYGWHVDGGMSSNDPPRKLSMVVQLSSPDEYEGGDLQIHGQCLSTVQKAQGLVTVFPSYTLHQVTPVTAGIRRSLVVWLCGPAFR